MTKGGFWSDFVYVIYSWTMGQLFGLMLGAVSMLASWTFVCILYRSSKSD